MTPETTRPLLWDPAGDFRPVADVLPALADWGTEPPERTRG